MAASREKGLHEVVRLKNYPGMSVLETGTFPRVMTLRKGRAGKSEVQVFSILSDLSNTVQT